MLGAGHLEALASRWQGLLTHQRAHSQRSSHIAVLTTPAQHPSALLLRLLLCKQVQKVSAQVCVLKQGRHQVAHLFRAAGAGRGKRQREAMNRRGS